MEMMQKRLFFNELADNWDNRFETQELKSFLQEFVPMFGLKKGQRILDVGTGTGILIPYLQQEVGSKGHITAIDYAEKMIKVCKSKYKQVSNIDFLVNKIEEIVFSSNSFDAVICFGVFPHLENKLRALNQINRILKKDGRLIIAHALSSKEILAHHKNSSPVVAQDTLPKKTEMRKLLKQTGFFRISITDVPGCHFCLSFKSIA
jgi:demethylmenaquinone methyltransferase/2-methoxy-6-polyprenyl-1,4-benzoquinol methylase